MEVDGAEGDDVGLLARYRLTRSLSLEGEIGKAQLKDESETRRVGAGLIWDLAPRSIWSPYLLGALGSWDGNRYAEGGVGLAYRMTDSLHLAVDLRGGMRGDPNRCEREEPTCIPPDGTQEPHETSSDDGLERYTRGRFSAILFF